MNILVIGSEGVIGTPLVQQLKEDPKNFVMRCDRIRKRADDYLMADITHYETLEAAFEIKPDIVFLLAGEVGRDLCEHWPTLAVENNIQGTLNVIRLCLKTGAKLVYAGTSEAYGELLQTGSEVTEAMRPLRPRGVYGLTKWLAEELIEYYHARCALRAVIVRICMCYGPGEYPSPFRSAIARFIDWARRGDPLVVHRGGMRSWCYIDDVVAGLIAAGHYNQEQFSVFNIGGNESLAMEEIAQRILQLTHSQSKIIFEDVPPGVTPVKNISSKKAEEILGWKPRVLLDEGLQRTIEWHVKQVSV